MSFQIITDSAANLTKEHVEQLGITVCPLGYVVDGEQFVPDLGNETEANALYVKMRNKSNVSTNSLNPEQLEQAFEKILKGGEDVLYLSFSSALSSCHDSALRATERLKDKYKSNKIVIVDTLSACMGQGNIVLETCKFSKGKTLEETVKFAEELKLKSLHFFTVDNLSYLQRGGRIKKSIAIIGGLLKIKPIMHVDDSGRLVAIGKKIGRALSIKELAALTAKAMVNPETQTVYICHADCINDALALKRELSALVQVKAYEINALDIVIGAHSGPGTLAIFTYGSKR